MMSKTRVIVVMALERKTRNTKRRTHLTESHSSVRHYSAGMRHATGILLILIFEIPYSAFAPLINLGRSLDHFGI